MSGASIREKLYDYIRVADEKKLKAIYNLLEDEIEETAEWWKDAAVVKEFDKRYDNSQNLFYLPLASHSIASETSNA